MKRIIIMALVACCAFAFGACDRPATGVIRRDFQKAFGAALPQSFSTVLLHKTSEDFHGDYGVYAVLSLSHPDFVTLERSLSGLPRAQRLWTTIDFHNDPEMRPYFRSASAIVETMTAGQFTATCALLSDRNQVAFIVEYY